MHNETKPHVICACGMVIQVMLPATEADTDPTWDEAATQVAYEDHCTSCPRA